MRSGEPATINRRTLATLVGAAALAGATRCLAAPAAPSPVGLWRYADKETGRPKADIRVTEQNGELIGVVEKPYPAPGEAPGRVCDKCPGDLKGHSFTGLQIMQGLHQDGDRWTGGSILDAESGTVYKCSLKPLADGTHVEVRGYVGLSLFGRTETWTRLE